MPPPARPLPPTLLPELNALLTALAIPFSLAHPTDLTPSLLLAIFESLISARLPIPAAVRQSRTRDSKARAMLVLLGVLECDVLRGGTEHDDSALAGAGGVSVDGWVDHIGLGEVDPARLADGGWEETIFIGELLCWLARRRRILPCTTSSPRRHPRPLHSTHHSCGTDDAELSSSLLLRPVRSSEPDVSTLSYITDVPRNPLQPARSIDADISSLSHITDVPRHPLVHSPEPSLSVSATTGTDLSIRARTSSSRTSVSNSRSDLEELDEDTLHDYDPVRMMQDAEDDDDQPPSFHPRCIHELEDPSYIRALAGNRSDDKDPDDLCVPPTPTPQRVRFTGWINPVDFATELDHFVASRSRSRTFNASAGSSQQVSQSNTIMSPHPRALGSGTPRTPPRVSPTPSPSPPLTPSSPYPPSRSPSLPTHSDPPFDVSFSTLNNTSTPAKPRGSRLTTIETVDGRHSRDTRTVRHPRRHALSPSFPPSYSIHSAPPMDRRQHPGSPPSPTMSTNARGPASPAILGSTATTSTLLTERARLLTELAALKRARAASGGDAGVASGVSGGIGRRVGVGV